MEHDDDVLTIEEAKRIWSEELEYGKRTKAQDKRIKKIIKKCEQLSHSARLLVKTVNTPEMMEYVASLQGKEAVEILNTLKEVEQEIREGVEYKSPWVADENGLRTWLDSYFVLGIEQEITLVDDLYKYISYKSYNEIENLAPILDSCVAILRKWKPLIAHPDDLVMMNENFAHQYDL